MGGCIRSGGFEGAVQSVSGPSQKWHESSQSVVAVIVALALLFPRSECSIVILFIN